MYRPGPLALVLAAFVAVFLLLPLFAVVPVSFTPARFLTMPSGDWSLRHYQALIDNPAWLQATLLSIRIALLSAAMMVLLAVVGPPPVDLHGLLHYAGIMDPLCGGTRSVYLTLNGDLAAAVRYNPAAPLVPLATLAVLVRAAVGRAFGRWITPAAPRGAVLAGCVTLALIALIALQINQQLNADLLTSGWPPVK